MLNLINFSFHRLLPPSVSLYCYNYQLGGKKDMKTKINSRESNKLVHSFKLNVDGRHLKVAFVPLCGLQHVCPQTKMVYPDDYVYCPYCGKKLR